MYSSFMGSITLHYRPPLENAPQRLRLLQQRRLGLITWLTKNNHVVQNVIVNKPQLESFCKLATLLLQ